MRRKAVCANRKGPMSVVQCPKVAAKPKAEAKPKKGN